MSLEAELRQLLVNVTNFRGDATELTLDYPLLDKEVLDSQGIFELIEEIESTYDIDIDEDEIVPDHFETLGAVVALVESKRA